MQYVQGGKPGNSYAQYQRSAPVSSTERSKSPPPAGNKKGSKAGKRKGKQWDRGCKGKCCFKCGKEGHFIAECRNATQKCLYTASASDLRCEDESNSGRCRCKCGNHTHFLNKEDVRIAAVVLEHTIETTSAT